MLGMGDVRVIKLFPSCSESPSLYSILSSCVRNRVDNCPLSFQRLPFRLQQEPFFLSPAASSKGNSQFMRHSLSPGLGVKSPTFPAIKQLQAIEVPPFPLHEVPAWDVSSLASSMTGMNSYTTPWPDRLSHSICKEDQGGCLNSGWGPKNPHLIMLGLWA